jgi:hypothetical protein
VDSNNFTFNIIDNLLSKEDAAGGLFKNEKKCSEFKNQDIKKVK